MQDATLVIRDLLQDNPDGLTNQEIMDATGLNDTQIDSAFKVLKPFKNGRRYTLTQPKDETKVYRDQAEVFKEIERLFLKHPKGLRVVDVAEKMQIPPRTAARYIDQLKTRNLRTNTSDRGYFVIVPTDEDVETSALTIRRAIENGLPVNDELLKMAELVIEQASRAS